MASVSIQLEHDIRGRGAGGGRRRQRRGPAVSQRKWSGEARHKLFKQIPASSSPRKSVKSGSLRWNKLFRRRLGWWRGSTSPGSGSLAAREHVSWVGQQGASDFSLVKWEQVSWVGQQAEAMEEVPPMEILRHSCPNQSVHLTSGKKAGDRSATQSCDPVKEYI